MPNISVRKELSRHPVFTGGDQLASSAACDILPPRDIRPPNHTK